MGAGRVAWVEDGKAEQWNMKVENLMIEYLRLDAKERAWFDQLYADRAGLQEIHDKLAKATPKQLQRVRERLDRKWSSEQAGKGEKGILKTESGGGDR